MVRTRLLITSLAALGLSGCMGSTASMISSRGASPDQIIASAATSEVRMSAQAAALNQMTGDIVRKSTLQGAAIGALAGCGLVVLSANNIRNCVGGALVGGAIGAVAGQANGHAQTAKRIELVSPSVLVRSIGKANDAMENVTRNLPGLLAEQDAELEKLNRKVAKGEITQAQFEHRYEAIRANRAQLAEALSLSAAQAKDAHRNLQSAQAKGQSGLDWHLSATQSLVRGATSARSSISLL